MGREREQEEEEETPGRGLDRSELRELEIAILKSDVRDHEKRLRLLEATGHRFAGMATLLALEIPLVVGAATAVIVAVIKLKG